MTTETLVLPADTIHDVLLDRARDIPDAIAIEFGDRLISYAETAAMARRFASQLAAMGVSRGDKVGIMLPNLPEFLFAYYGALMAGATVVLYNVMLTPSEIEYLAEHSETRLMVIQDRLLPALEAARPKLTTLEHIVVIGRAKEEMHSFDALLAEGDPGFSPAEVRMDDLAHLIYTSGTTGRPKGAMILHRNVLANLASINLMRPAAESAKVLCVLPLFHAFGLIAVMNATIMRGGTVFLHPRFESGPVIEALRNRGITTFSGTPTMFFHILNDPSSQGAKFPTLERAGSGGAPMPVEIRREFRRRFDIDITEGYGMSETTVSALGYPIGLPTRERSVGVPLPGVQVRVVDEEGKDSRMSVVGEIICRGPNIMHGYYRDPEATAQALRDGWLHTGDLGYIDDKGYYYIVDRIKDMIIKGGYNIYPREIEEVIYELPEVNMAAVIGVPDPAKGESVIAFISPKPGTSLAPGAIREHLASKLSKYKLPERIHVVDAIPTGPTGKILKRELRKEIETFTAAAVSG